MYSTSEEPGLPGPGDIARSEQTRMIAAIGPSATRVEQLGTDMRTGRLMIDPAAGEQLRAALREQADLASAWRDRARAMACPIPLGRNVVGDAMARTFQRRADGEPSSLAAVLDRYLAGLLDAHAAVGEAMRRYAEAEQAQAAAFRGLHPR